MQRSAVTVVHFTQRSAQCTVTLLPVSFPTTATSSTTSCSPHAPRSGGAKSCKQTSLHTRIYTVVFTWLSLPGCLYTVVLTQLSLNGCVYTVFFTWLSLHCRCYTVVFIELSLFGLLFTVIFIWSSLYSHLLRSSSINCINSRSKWQTI